MRKFGLTSLAAAALIAASFSVAGVVSPASAAPAALAGTAVSGLAGTSAQGTSSRVTRRQAKKRKALKRCRTKRSSKLRKACRKRVNRKFRVKRKPPVQVEPVKPAATIDVGDDYFSPDLVNIERGDVIRWVWNDLNHDPHDVNLVTGPEGVDRGDYNTGSLPAVGFTFSRRFVVPGAYYFACSVHFKMTMKVVVS